MHRGHRQGEAHNGGLEFHLVDTFIVIVVTQGQSGFSSYEQRVAAVERTEHNLDVVACFFAETKKMMKEESCCPKRRVQARAACRKDSLQLGMGP